MRIYFFHIVVLLILAGNSKLLLAQQLKGENIADRGKSRLEQEEKKLESVVRSSLKYQLSKINGLDEKMKPLFGGSLIRIGNGGFSGVASSDNGSFYEREFIFNNQIQASAKLKGIPIDVELLYNQFPDYGDIRSVSNGVRWRFNFDHAALVTDYKENLKRVVNELKDDEFLDSAAKAYKNELISGYSHQKEALGKFLKNKTAGFQQYAFLLQDSLKLDELGAQLGSQLIQERLKGQGEKADSILVEEKKFIDSARILVEKARQVQAKMEEVKKYASDVKAQLMKGIDAADLKKDGLTGLLNASFLERLLLGLKDLRVGNFVLPGSFGNGMSGAMSGLGIGFNNGKNFGSLDMGTIRPEMISPSQVGNVLPGFSPDSVLAIVKPPKLWRFSFGKGDPEKEYVRLDVSGIELGNGAQLGGYSIGVATRFALLKEVWMRASLEKNATIAGNQKGVVAISSAVLRSMKADFFRNLNHLFELKGSHGEGRMSWTAGYESVSPGLIQQFGLVTPLARKRYYFQYKLLFPGNKLSSSLRIDRRNYASSMGNAGNNISTFMRGELKYKFKPGKFLLAYVSPASSKYGSSLEDSLIQQVVKGNTLGVGGGYRSRVKGLNIGFTGNAELYLMKIRQEDVPRFVHLEAATPPEKSIGLNFHADVQTKGKLNYYMQWMGVVNGKAKNSPSLSGSFPAYGNNFQGSAGAQYQLSLFVLSGMGAGYYYMAGFNKSLFVTPEIGFTRKEWMLRASAHVNVLAAEQSNQLYGFGNRYELTYQIKW